MKTYMRKAKMADLGKYCHLAKENDYIEVTEWENGEGFDVSMSSGPSIKNFSLTWGEFEAVTTLVHYKD